MNERVQKLIKRVDERHEERERHKRAAELATARDREIKEAPRYLRQPFWCSSCKRDYDAIGEKQVRTLSKPPIAWYVGKCPCSVWNLRRITDRAWDPYFDNSALVKRHRVEFAKDLLQPGMPGYETLYGKVKRADEHEEN